MTQNKNHHNHSYHSRISILVLTLLGFYSITMLNIVATSEEVSAKSASQSLSISSQSSLSSAEATPSDESSSKEGPLLKFLLRPVDSGSVEQANTDNNAAIHKGSEQRFYHKDNEDDNNESNVSSESDSEEVHRFRREEEKIPPTGGSKVITSNWGTYEEQAPVVVQSEARNIDDDEEGPSFSDEYKAEQKDDQSEYGGHLNHGSIPYDDYEEGRFEGRQFYPSRSAAASGYDSSEEQEHSDGYYRQKYYATTAKPVNQYQQEPVRGDESQENMDNRIQRPNRPQQRPQYRQPQNQDEDSAGNNGIMGLVQKAKTFYDIFKAMNSAWKTVEEHYRKNGQGVFPEDLKKMNESERLALTKPYLQQNTNRPKTTNVPTTVADEEQNTTHDEYRSRRSSAKETVNDEKSLSSSSDTTQTSETDLEPSASDSSSSTAVAEGRYIKGDPLKGYYDFVITEGSYKFWAVFQVGTAILIIYSTFAAIYYSKVNPLVSDYDYIDYLGGGRSLSDDSDFVDTDAPADSKTAAGPSKGGVTRSRQQQQSSAGWFDWVPHAGHTLRFILESIDKGYNEE